MRRNRPTDHALRVVSLGGISMPTFWIALVALYVGFYKLGWFPGADRLDPGVTPPPSKTGLYTVDALLAGDWDLFVQALHHLILPGARARGVQRQPADALHAFGRARGLRQRLRSRRAGEGPAGACRRQAIHPARGASVGRDGHRARLRERPHRRGARGEDLLLAGSRPVRVHRPPSISTCRRLPASACSSPSSTSRSTSSSTCSTASSTRGSGCDEHDRARGGGRDDAAG